MPSNTMMLVTMVMLSMTTVMSDTNTDLVQTVKGLLAKEMRLFKEEYAVFQNTSELEERVTQLEVEVLVLHESRQVHTEQITEIEDEAAELETEVTLLHESQVLLQDELVSQEHQIQAIREEVQDVEDETTGIEHRTDTLENTAIEHEIEIEQLTQEVETWSSLVDQLNDRVTAVEDLYYDSLEICNSNPCSNGASCVGLFGDQFFCICPSGHYGLLCENDLRDASFVATFSFTSSSIDNGILIFDSVVSNPGDHYDPTNGEYTVPTNGTYQIYYQVTAAETYPDFYLEVDGVDYLYTRAGSSSTHVKSSPGYMVMHLYEGQVVRVESVCGAACAIYGLNAGSMWSWFAADLIYAD